MHELTQSKNAQYAELKLHKTEVTMREGEMEVLRKQMETINEGKSDINKQIDAINDKITKITADISALYAKKDEQREAHFKHRYDYEVQRDLIQHINWIKDQKDAIIARESEKVHLAEQRKQMIKDLPHPYAKEIETCSHLVNYCHQLKRKAGLELDSEEVAKQMQQSLLAEANREKIANKLADGKLLDFSSKQEREQSQFTTVGGGKKNKGKKQKEVQYEDIFNFDVVLIQKFGLIQISPPMNAEDLDKKISEISAKN